MRQEPSARDRVVSLATKRALDVTAASVGLAALGVALGAAAVAIALDTPGPIFYRGERVGRDGRRFRIFKFRTMRVDADKLGPSSTSSDDPRVTRVGRTLRKYKLDELPQLINVLLGDMSLVGPRPQVAWAVELYDAAERRILSVRPGITDWASIEFRNEGELLAGHADPDKAYLELIHPRKTALALKYVEERSLRVDLSILWMTLTTLIKERGRRADE